MATSETLVLITDDDGDAEAYSGYYDGRLVELAYVAAGKTNELASGFSITVKVEGTERTVWSETISGTDATAGKVLHLVMEAADDAGDARVEAAAPYLVNDRLLFTVSSGGAQRRGVFRMVVA